MIKKKEIRINKSIISFQILPIWRDEKISILRDFEESYLSLNILSLIIFINLNKRKILIIPSFPSPLFNEFLSKCNEYNYKIWNGLLEEFFHPVFYFVTFIFIFLQTEMITTHEFSYFVINHKSYTIIFNTGSEKNWCMI